MAIDVEVRHVAVHALAHQIRHVTECQKIGAAIETESVLKTQPLSGQHLVENGLQLTGRRGWVGLGWLASEWIALEQYVSCPKHEE